jgi:hypothetical protein
MTEKEQTKVTVIDFNDAIARVPAALKAADPKTGSSRIMGQFDPKTGIGMTPIAALIYPALFTPRTRTGKDSKTKEEYTSTAFEVTAVFPKSEIIKKYFTEASNAVCRKAFGSDTAAWPPLDRRYPLKDGDERYAETLKTYQADADAQGVTLAEYCEKNDKRLPEHLKGRFYLNMKQRVTDNTPKDYAPDVYEVVQRSTGGAPEVVTLGDKSGIYSGVVVLVSFRAYGYGAKDTREKRGVMFQLEGVVKLVDAPQLDLGMERPSVDTAGMLGLTVADASEATTASVADVFGEPDAQAANPATPAADNIDALLAG